MKEAFELFDKNGDGHISADELGKVLRAIGQNPTEAMIKEVMAKADKDGKEFTFVIVSLCSKYKQLHTGKYFKILCDIKYIYV